MFHFAASDLLNASSLWVASGIDVLILLLVFLNVVRGRKLGLAGQVLFDVGFFLGLFLGVQLVPFTSIGTMDRSPRVAIAIFTIVGTGLFLGFVGGRLGTDWGVALRKRWGLDKGKGVLGGIVSGITCIVLVWFISGLMLNSSARWLAAGLERSVILRALDTVAPPVPDVVTHLQASLDPNGFTQVFTDLEPLPPSGVIVAAQAVVNQAAAADEYSTVRVDGFGCGGLVSGGGFVVAPDLVMTAAHVVAGLNHPFATDRNGVHAVTVVWFDSDTDVALLRVSNLAGQPLRFAADDQPNGAVAVVLGFPDGGAFTAGAAGFLSSSDTIGHDIYGRGQVTRSVYTLEAQVRPGNSGGPVVLPDGSVAGMVIARSLLSDQVGYALTPRALRPSLAAVDSHASAVSVGTCTEAK